MARQVFKAIQTHVVVNGFENTILRSQFPYWTLVIYDIYFFLGGGGGGGLEPMNNIGLSEIFVDIIFTPLVCGGVTCKVNRPWSRFF